VSRRNLCDPFHVLKSEKVALNGRYRLAPKPGAITVFRDMAGGLQGVKPVSDATCILRECSFGRSMVPVCPGAFIAEDRGARPVALGGKFCRLTAFRKDAP
jgi:hypothetical protein